MLAVFVATASLVFLRAIQQQNVIHGHNWLAAGTSYVIALAEVAVVLWVVRTGWSAVLPMGTGGAMGVTLAMLVHRRYVRK